MDTRSAGAMKTFQKLQEVIKDKQIYVKHQAF